MEKLNQYFAALLTDPTGRAAFNAKVLELSGGRADVSGLSEADAKIYVLALFQAGGMELLQAITPDSVMGTIYGGGATASSGRNAFWDTTLGGALQQAVTGYGNLVGGVTSGVGGLVQGAATMTQANAQYTAAQAAAYQQQTAAAASQAQTGTFFQDSDGSLKAVAWVMIVLSVILLGAGAYFAFRK